MRVALVDHMDGPSGTPTALSDALLAEHTKLETLLDDVIGGAEVLDDTRAVDAWKVFGRALLAQLDAEDRHLVAVLPDERSARILINEHRYVRSRLLELGRAVEEGTVELGALKNFRDVLRAHAKSDDRLLYRWAEAELDERQRDAILDELRTRLASH